MQVLKLQYFLKLTSVDVAPVLHLSPCCNSVRKLRQLEESGLMRRQPLQVLVHYNIVSLGL